MGLGLGFRGFGFGLLDSALRSVTYSGESSKGSSCSTAHVRSPSTSCWVSEFELGVRCEPSTWEIYGRYRRDIGEI